MPHPSLSSHLKVSYYLEKLNENKSKWCKKEINWRKPTKKDISTTKRAAQHLFAGLNIQHPCIYLRLCMPFIESMCVVENIFADESN